MNNVGCWELFFNDNGDDSVTLHEFNVWEAALLANEQERFMYMHRNSYGVVLINLSNMTYAHMVVCSAHPYKRHERKRIKDS